MTVWPRFFFGSMLVVIAFTGLSGKIMAAEPAAMALRSASGIDFTYVQLPDAKSVTVAAGWRSNWVAQGLQPSAPHVGTELMLVGGAGGRDAATLSADLQSINALFKLFPSAGYARLVLSVDADDLAEAAEIAADVISRPSLDPNWFARIRATQSANVEQNAALQAQQAQQLIRNIAFEGDPVARSLMPLPSDFATLDAAAVKDWHRMTFNLENLQVSAAGPLSVESMAEEIDMIFHALPRGQKVPVSTTRPANKLHKSILLYTPSTPKTFVSIAGRLPPLRETPEISGFFGALALADGQSSRLNQAIRTELRATYAMSAGLSSLTPNARLLQIEGEIEGSKLGQALALLRTSYEKLRVNGLTLEEFSSIKQKIANHLEAVKGQPDYAANAILQAKLSGMPSGEGLRLLEEVKLITLDEVNRNIAARFPPYSEMLKVIASSDDKAIIADCVVTTADNYRLCISD